MRRSRSNPAKYARNYRKISQRQMSRYDDIDEEKEIKRLKNVLKNSEDHLKHVQDSADESDNSGSGYKHSNNSNKNKKKRRSFQQDDSKQEKERNTSGIENRFTNNAQQENKTIVDDDDEQTQIERARELLRNSDAHLTQVPNSSIKDMQFKTSKKGKKRSRDEGNNTKFIEKDLENSQVDTSVDKEKERKDPSKNNILSEEFLAENQMEGDADLVIVHSKKKKQKKKRKIELSPEEIQQAKQVKKKTERKLKQLAVRAEQKKKRSDLYEKLQKNAISTEEMQLMLSSSTLGKRLSKKELLKALLRKERAGMELTEEERQLLYRDRNGNDSENDLKLDGNKQFSIEEAEGISQKQLAQSQEGSKDKQRGTTDYGPDNEGKNSQHKSQKSESSKDKNDAKSPTHHIDEGPKAEKKAKSTPAMANASSFAAQMMASLTKLKVVSELQKEELEKQEADEAELKRLNAEKKQSETKGAPYKAKNPVKIQTAATNKNLPVRELPMSNRPILTINRPADIQEWRYGLPVAQMEYEVMDAIRNNDVTIICGETGSGKSTQIPQLLYESGFSLGTHDDKKQVGEEFDNKFLVGITQPRRVAAVSTAKRVCYEMGHGDGRSIKAKNRRDGNCVAYQTRYETAGLGEKTCVKFMTDGILLQEIQSDLLLRKYSVIVLDECHERNLNCDILCGLIGLALPLRKRAADEPGSRIVPLKLVIMSATLRVDDFLSNDKLFPSTKPFIVKVPGRTFPVTIHHSRVTELDDYEDAAFRKICKIHRRLPQGGILVFLTGKQEIVRMVKRLRKALSSGDKNEARRVASAVVDANDVSTSRTNIAYCDEMGPRDLDDDEVDGDLFDSRDKNDVGDSLEIDIDVHDSESADLPEPDEDTPKNVIVLPLYSMMSTEDQAKVFAAVPEGTRLIVCATNIAETSITIPNISYVVDTGRQKSKSYDSKTGVASFDISWISKAAANQRAGRAGRTGPGHCYRLYSSSLFARHMDDFALPEVLMKPLEDVILAMKAMKISNISKFPFPTPPAQDQIDAALKLLANLGCVDLKERTDMDDDGQVTRLGAAVSTFPLGVRCGKMLLVAAHAGVLDYAIAIVAAFSEKNPFLGGREQNVDGNGDDEQNGLDDHLEDPETENEPRASNVKRWVHSAGDIYATMLAIGAYTFAGRGAGGISEKVACKQFCEETGLNPVIMERIQKIRVHLSRLVKTRMAGADGIAVKTGKIPHNMKPPNKLQEKLLLQVIASGLLDNVAMLAPLGSIPGSHPFSLRSAFLSCSSSIKEPLLMDQNSVLFSRDSRRLPRWVCYDYLVRKTLKDGTPIATMKNVTPVDTSWLGSLAKGSHLLSLGGPLATPRPAYDPDRDVVMCAVETKFGNHGWEIAPVKIPMGEALSTAAAKHSVNFQPDDSFRYFARFLLEGKILPDFRKLELFFNDNPSIITSKTPVSKVGLLVSALSNAGVDSASALRRHWREVDKKFLFRHLKGWVKPQYASEAKKIWIDTVEKTVATENSL